MASVTFDYIIVGGGTAGCVLASRLSAALPNDSTLIIEASPKHDARVAPSMAAIRSDASDIQWNHETVPQKALGGARVPQIQGKVLGGSSAINYQAWTRGAATEFDKWASDVGDRRWSWEGLLPYFRKSETFIPPKTRAQERQPHIHGYDGPITVPHVSSSGRPRNYPMKAMVADIYEKAGIPQIQDLNSGDPCDGICEFANSTFNGERQWAASCYKRASNVTLWDKTQVAKLIFSGKRVTGVELLPNHHGGTRVLAKKEVLVSAGAQNSAKLLLLSGLGPKEELERHNIAKLVDLPVGENYSDHPFLATYWKIRDRNMSLGDMEMIGPYVDWTAGTGSDFLSFLKHEGEDLKALVKQTLDTKALELFELPGKPHTEAFALYGHRPTPGLTPPEGSCFTLHHVLVSPSSRGTVPRKLHTSTQKSIALSKHGAVEYGIDEDIRNDFSDKAIRKRLLRTVRTLSHGSGTCAMGTVVDSECRVMGVEELRVVDASVYPFPIAAHYQAVVYAVAELMADIIVANSNLVG